MFLASPFVPNLTYYVAEAKKPKPSPAERLANASCGPVGFFASAMDVQS